MSESILSRRKAFFLSSETSSISNSNSDSLSSTQSLVDGLVTRFVDEAADVKTLAALTAAGLAYRWGKGAVLSSQLSVLSRGGVLPPILRGGSVAFGLTTEVTAFEFTHRTLHTLTGGHAGPPLQNQPSGQLSPNLWSWNGNGGWKQSLINDFVTFGLLKGAGHLSRESNVVFQHAFSSTAMVGGHQATASLGVTPKPEGSLAEQFLHAEITNIQLGAGTSLVHSLAPRMVALERGLDLSLQSHSLTAGWSQFPGRSPLLMGPRWALAEGFADGAGKGPSPLRDLRKNPHILQMSAPKDPTPGGPIGKMASSERLSDPSHSFLSLASQLGVDVSSFREGQDLNKIVLPLRTQVMDLISYPEISLSLSSESLNRLQQFVIGGVESVKEIERSLQELIEKGRENHLISSPVIAASPLETLRGPEEGDAKLASPPISVEPPPEPPSKMIIKPQEGGEPSPPISTPEIDPQLVEARIEIDRLRVQLGMEKHKTERMAEFEARVKELEQLLRNANGELTTVANNHATASNRVAELERELGDKGKELAAALTEAGNANSRAEGWRQSHDELKKKAEEIIREYRGQAEAVEAELKRVRAENAHISQARTETLDESIELESRLRGQLAASETKARKLTHLVKPMQNERDEARRLVEEKERELGELRLKIEGFEEKLMEVVSLKAALGEAIMERDQAQVLLRAARKDVDRINGYRLRAIQVRKRANEQTLAILGELRDQVRQQKETIEALQRENSQIGRDRDLEKARADQEKARADALTIRVGELETQGKDLKAELEKAREALTLAERRLEARRTQLEGEQKTAFRLREEIERLKGVIAEASRQADAKDLRIRGLNARIRELEEMADIASHVVSEEETQLRAEADRLGDENQILNQNLQTARGILELREKQIAAALKRSVTLEGQLAKAREALGVKERDYGDLLRRFIALDNEAIGLRAEAALKVRAVEALARQVEENNRLRGRNEEAQGKVNRAKEENQRLKEELEFAQGDVALSEGALTEMQGELGKAKEALEAKKAELKKIREELAELRRSGRAQETRIAQLTRRETYLTERVGKLEKEREELKKKVGEK